MKCDICGIEANWILDEKSYCSKHHKEKIGGTMTESKSEIDNYVFELTKYISEIIYENIEKELKAIIRANYIIPRTDNPEKWVEVIKIPDIKYGEKLKDYILKWREDK